MGLSIISQTRKPKNLSSYNQPTWNKQHIYSYSCVYAFGWNRSDEIFYFLFIAIEVEHSWCGMGDGPSPLIPSMALITIGLVTYWRTLLSRTALMIFNTEQTGFDFVISISLMVFTMVHFVGGSIIVSLVPVLVIYLFGKMIIGPLMFIVSLSATFHLRCKALDRIQIWREEVKKVDGHSFFFLSSLLVLYGLLCEGEG